MHQLLCATGNSTKFELGKALLAKHNIALEQVVVDIDEIQGEDPEVVIRDKAQKAYALTGQPTIVSDDSWNLPGLNGFPGPYMKSINHWFTPDDFIRLTKDLKDRTIFLQQVLAYRDEYETVIFRTDILGSITKEPRGSFGSPIMKIVVLDGDDDMTMSQIFEQSIQHEAHRSQRLSGAWQQLADWYEQKLPG